MKITNIPIDKLNPATYNPRLDLKPEDKEYQDIKRSIIEFTLVEPLVINKDMVIIGGHQRLKVLKDLQYKEVPCIVVDLDKQKEKMLNIALNKISGDWDRPRLKDLLEELDSGEFDVNLTGWGEQEMEDLMTEFHVEPEEDDFDVDKAVEDIKEPICKRGDIWQLGDHRLGCLDATVEEDVKKLMDGKRAALLHADPPYGMGKENDGVQNDNLYREKLDAFQMKWWRAFRPFLYNNASAYIWGNSEDLWRLWYAGGLKESERITFRNEIIWDKGYGQGMESERHRMFPTVTERCLFFMLGEQGFNNNADNYWEGWDSVVNYLREEKKKTGWDIAKFKRLAGHSETSGCHWFDKSQWNFPTREVYNSWRAESKDNAFKKDYDELKKDFYATRAYFDNTHDKMTDVFNFPRVVGEEREGHATPKPIKMMAQLIESSLPECEICIEPFGGSGTTLMAAEQTNRICYISEISEVYCDVIIKRWETYTNKKAVIICN